ncbi:hypothetical protein L5L98_15205, partial [Shewanella sp. SM23]|nr:hypothetical protein [Shewanella sp. SM23]
MFKKGLPLLFLAAPLQAAPVLSHLSGRGMGRSANSGFSILREQDELSLAELAPEFDGAQSFAAFTDSYLPELSDATVVPHDVLSFLSQNDLLQPSQNIATSNSGDLDNDFNKRFSGLVFLCSPDYYSTSSGCRIQSITRQTPATSPTDADSLIWRLLFDVPVSGVGAVDFTVGGTTATITSVVQNSSTDYSMTLSGGNLANLNGTVTIELAPTYDIRLVKTGALMESRGDDNLNDGGADAVNGTNDNFYLLVNSSTPVVTDGNISISGAAGTGGTYRMGDTVTATWNNTAGGDNNADLTGVTVDFSQFGGGAAVVASNSSGTWTATYTITAGGIDAGSRNVSITATNAGGPTTTADTSNATVDNIAPTVSNAFIGISGATGTGGAYKIGDTVTASWDNSAFGDDNSDTISAATVNFSQFGGGAAVAATNSSGTWTATYTIVAGAIDT